ncbi:Protein of unknown function (DUF2905) [Thermanaerovibrio velox DSM 12556]|uniref:DUF2905 domain-containing protein n=1 Tax=Thermanaerovibrio velox DSM 12556 TaxID=926567 RepID=H0URW0_9BACT|nr:DUF2905 domain-containing protein [Thermanaerovibrio velox]EHM10049.1 Protein of unknown function (DUF2905) [Thermanaerovibrio velox DSM 12556]
MWNLGKAFVLIGVVFLFVGLIVLGLSKFNLPIGKLPGDIVITRKNFTFFAPLGSMLVFSLVLSILLNVIYRIIGR